MGFSSVVDSVSVAWEVCVAGWVGGWVDLFQFLFQFLFHVLGLGTSVNP